MGQQPFEGALVVCWGVGCNMDGELGVLVEISYCKVFPYRIKTIGKKGRGLYYGRGDFKMVVL